MLRNVQSSASTPNDEARAIVSSEPHPRQCRFAATTVAALRENQREDFMGTNPRGVTEN